MKKILQNSLFFILGFVPFCSVAKAETVASPLSYASNVWVGRSEAVIRVLDKLESRSTVFTIPVGEKQQYKTLTIEVKACVIRPPLMASDSAAFVDLVDTHPDTPHFAAWIFQEEPAISVYENPVYNVAVVQCSGNPVAPNLPAASREAKQNNNQGPSKGPDDNKTKPSDDTKSTPQDNAASLEQFLKSP